MQKIFIKTYGCQSNIADSETIAGIVAEKGYSIVSNESDADFVIVNTCSVKNATQGKELHYLRKLADTKKIVVGGCLTKTIDVRKYAPKVYAVFDTNSLKKVPEILTQQHDAFSTEKETDRLSLPVIRRQGDVGIVPISQGCLNACTFCATKHARGTLVSYRIGDIKRAVEKNVKDGCNTIYLTSQDTGCYGQDIHTTLPELLNTLIEIDGKFVIRIGMMNPWHAIKILNPLLKLYKSSKIMKFIHIPVQSGSNNVLKDMQRVHTVETFQIIAKRFREVFPTISIATDIIIGYPTETEHDFQETIDLITKLKPEVLNISKFSSRKGTSAAKLKPLPSQIIDDRSKRLSAVYHSYAQQLMGEEHSRDIP